MSVARLGQAPYGASPLVSTRNSDLLLDSLHSLEESRRFFIIGIRLFIVVIDDLARMRKIIRFLPSTS